MYKHSRDLVKVISPVTKPKLNFLLIKVASNENFIYKSIYKIITKFQFQTHLNTFMLLQYTNQNWPKLNFLTNKDGLK